MCVHVHERGGREYVQSCRSPNEEVAGGRGRLRGYAYRKRAEPAQKITSEWPCLAGQSRKWLVKESCLCTQVCKLIGLS